MVRLSKFKVTYIYKFYVLNVSFICFYYYNYRLICVGGDGMFSEILNGLLNRTEHDNNVEETCSFEPVPPDIRIGIIPAGMFLSFEKMELEY
jgi:hypothetical protein